MNKYIINADDFGLSPSVNEAIARCFAQELIQRTTTMVNMPSFKDGCALAEKEGFKNKVGLHLTLDEGAPLSERIKGNPKMCRDGQFIKGWFAGMKNKVFLSRYDRQCLKEEVEAQMQGYCEAGYTLMHLDSHHTIHTSSPLMISIVVDQAIKYGFKSMRNVAVYKKDNILNRLIKKYVTFTIKQHFQTTTNFASYSQYPLDLDDVEYMSHPDMVGGVVVDYDNRSKKQYREFKR